MKANTKKAINDQHISVEKVFMAVMIMILQFRLCGKTVEKLGCVPD